MQTNSNLTRSLFKSLFQNLLGVCFGTGLLIRFIVVIVLAIHYKQDFKFIKEADFFAKGLLLWVIIAFLSVVLEFGFSIFSIVTARLKRKGLKSWANRSAFLVVLGVIYNAVHIQLYINSLNLTDGSYWNVTTTLQFVNIIASALLESAGFFMEDTETPPPAETTETPETTETKRNEMGSTTVSTNTFVDKHGRVGVKTKPKLDYIILTGNRVQIDGTIWDEKKVKDARRAVTSKINRREGNAETNARYLVKLSQIQDLINGVIDFDDEDLTRMNPINGHS